MTKEFFRKNCPLHQTRKISQAVVKACSNLQELVFTPEYMDHELHKREPKIHRFSNGWGPTIILSGETQPDAVLYVYQDSSMEELEFFWEGNEYFLAGPVIERERTSPDRRYTVYSTGGLLTRIMPGTLEHKGISCLHATSVYNPDTDHMMIFVGGPGAGKTILMLEACLRRGYQLISTEYTHFQTLEGKPRFYLGSVFDNVRVGNLIYHYTEYERVWGKEIFDSLPEGANPWSSKVALDMTPLLPNREVIIDPKVSLVFVKIEGHREQAVVEDLRYPSVRFQLYLNAAELISRPRLFFGCLPVPSLDTSEKAKKRLEIVDQMLASAHLVECKSIFAGVNNAWIWNE